MLPRHQILSGILLPICGFVLLVVPACASSADASPATVPSVGADLNAIHQRVKEAEIRLGDRAGIPEEPDQYEKIPKDGRWLSTVEAKGAFAMANPRLERMKWWNIGIDPTNLAHELREPAAVISGCAAAYRAGLTDADRSLSIARDAADFLIWAQAQAGTGVFPFPSTRNVTGKKPFAAAESSYAKAGREGRMDQMMHNGWTIDDAGTGGLQFDNGEAGVAMLELYETTREQKYLESARKAADWAISRPLAENWNYNSFSVRLLAKAYDVTHERRFLEAAAHKAIAGVIPGQLDKGPRAGRWLDAHNSKPNYHYIIMNSLAQLALVMPEDDPARPEVMRSLQLGLLARNRDFSDLGSPNRNKAMETLVLVNRGFAEQRDFLRDSKSEEALDALGKLVSELYRSGVAPLGPKEWGAFLSFIVWKSIPTAGLPTRNDTGRLHSPIGTNSVGKLTSGSKS